MAATLAAGTDAVLSHRSAAAPSRAVLDPRQLERALAAEGCRVVRITWRQLHEQADELAEDLRTLLA